MRIVRVASAETNMALKINRELYRGLCRVTIS
jgi:hypothetical protein